LGDFDIQSASNEIVSAERLVETESLSLENPTFDGRDANIHVKGNVNSGAAIRGSGSLFIDGSLLGSERWPCRIEVDGDVVVRGDAANAVVKCGSLRIGSETTDCRINACKGMEVGSDLARSQILIGEFDAEKREIERLKQDILQNNKIKDATDRQLKLEQRRMHKQLNTTRFTLDFNLGKIVRLRRNRIEIDLQPFYKIVSDKTEAEVDNALREFFAKAVVGLLTRSNLHLIQKNPNRQKIFKSIIRSMHDLFFLTRKFDKQTYRVIQDDSHLKKQVDDLSGQNYPLCIRGTVMDLDLQFILPSAEQVEDGEVLIESENVRLTIREEEDTQQPEIIITDTNGIESTEDTPLENLHQIAILPEENRIAWKKISTIVKESAQQ